jgi:Zinc carboxypeptidase/Cytosolic carboxypeptidase N-terminal domain
MIALVIAAISIFTNFPGGSAGKVEQISSTHLRIAIKGESDQDHRNRQANWYYFALDNLPKSKIEIDLTNLIGEYNYRPAHAVTKRTRPVYSYDGVTWKHFSDNEVEWNEERVELRLTFIPEKHRMWIAHTPPYTNANLDALLSQYKGSRFLQKQVAGKTVEGRDILLLTITSPQTSSKGKRVIWLMFRQHSWESGTSWACDGALRFLLSADPRASQIRDHTIIKIFPMADPDGVARGGVRFNNNGYDLNRNWDTVDPVKMPEITAQRKAVFDWLDEGHPIDLFLTMHNTESGEYLEAVDDRQLFQRLFRLLRDTTSFYPTSPLRIAAPTTSPGKAGRMTVIQGLWKDRKVPAMLMEQMVEYNAKLGRLPTVEDRQRFGVELIQSLYKAVANQS